jgi:hypothetical protein
MGLFFGYQDDPTHGPSQQRFQVVQVRAEVRDGAPGLTLRRGQIVMDASGQVLRREDAPVTAWLHAPTTDRVLEVQVDSNAHVRVTWDGIAGEELPPGVLPQLAPDDVQGRFGLFIEGGTGIFRNLHYRYFPNSQEPS